MGNIVLDFNEQLLFIVYHETLSGCMPFLQDNKRCPWGSLIRSNLGLIETSKILKLPCISKHFALRWLYDSRSASDEAVCPSRQA